MPSLTPKTDEAYLSAQDSAYPLQFMAERSRLIEAQLNAAIQQRDKLITALRDYVDASDWNTSLETQANEAISDCMKD